ncbi:MAG: AMP-binding protein [Solobacterium sp.]|nr:AMP-binding protein [Solobacterium sp.]
MAIIYQGEQITYQTMYRRIHSMRLKLREMGSAKGSKAVIWGYNSALWLIAFFAVVAEGGAVRMAGASLHSYQEKLQVVDFSQR